MPFFLKLSNRVLRLQNTVASKPPYYNIGTNKKLCNNYQSERRFCTTLSCRIMHVAGARCGIGCYLYCQTIVAFVGTFVGNVAHGCSV